MTAAESSALVIDLIAQLAEARRERNAYRALAVAGVEHAHVMDRRDVQQRRQVARLREEVRRLRLRSQDISNNDLGTAQGVGDHTRAMKTDMTSSQHDVSSRAA